MKAPAIRMASESVALVELHGDPRRRPEPETVRIRFPGGEVEVVRCTDGDYWAHVRIETPEDVIAADSAGPAGRFTDARLDIHGKHTSDVDTGEFAHPELYHLAVRVSPRHPEGS